MAINLNSLIEFFTFHQSRKDIRLRKGTTLKQALDDIWNEKGINDPIHLSKWEIVD